MPLMVLIHTMMNKKATPLISWDLHIGAEMVHKNPNRYIQFSDECCGQKNLRVCVGSGYFRLEVQEVLLEEI